VLADVQHGERSDSGERDDTGPGDDGLGARQADPAGLSRRPTSLAHFATTAQIAIAPETTVANTGMIAE
jgi:hypothetical protein